MAGRRPPPTPARQVRSSNPLAITGQPQETFSFTLAMDSNDTIADGNAGQRRDRRGDGRLHASCSA